MTTYVDCDMRHGLDVVREVDTPTIPRLQRIELVPTLRLSSHAPLATLH